MFIGGQALFAMGVSYDYNYFENISNFSKYLFVFVIYFSLYKLQDDPDRFESIIRLLEKLFLLNSIAVFIGFAFQIDFLRTYVGQSYRYGYSGFIPAQNEATLFFLLSASYFYYKRFIQKVGSANKFYLVVLSCVLLGTKGIYVFLALLLLFHFLYHSALKTKLVSLVVVSILYFGVSWFLTTDSAKTLLNYFIFNAQRTDLLTMLLSSRNMSVISKVPEIFNNWSVLNYLIGGQDQVVFLMEMDFIDMFFFFGIIGSIIFLTMYLAILFRFNKMKPFNLFFVSSFFVLAFLAGHFFSSAVNALYLCLVSMYFYISQKPANLSNE